MTSFEKVKAHRRQLLSPEHVQANIASFIHCTPADKLTDNRAKFPRVFGGCYSLLYASHLSAVAEWVVHNYKFGAKMRFLGRPKTPKRH